MFIILILPLVVFDKSNIYAYCPDIFMNTFHSKRDKTRPMQPLRGDSAHGKWHRWKILMVSKELKKKKKKGMKYRQQDRKQWLRHWRFKGGSSVLEVKSQSSDSPSSKLLLSVPIKTEALGGWSAGPLLHLEFGEVYERHLGAGFLQQSETQSLLSLFFFHRYIN